MNDIKHGIPAELPLGQKLGIRVAVVNLFYKDETGEAQTDAALLLMRRSFGLGRMNVTLLRQNAYLVMDNAELADMATQAAQHLFSGSASPHDIANITDIILYSLDALVMHPPEDEMILRKREQEKLARMGLLVKANDKIILDAR